MQDHHLDPSQILLLVICKPRTMQHPVSPDVGTGLESQTHALASKAIATECKAILRPLPQQSLRSRIMMLSSKAKYTSSYDGTSSVSPCRMLYWPRIICRTLDSSITPSLNLTTEAVLQAAAGFSSGVCGQ